MSVVIVDDDPIFRSLAAVKLVRYGCRIVEAEDGTIGWTCMMREPFDLAVLDLEMPNMSGIDLIRCIRGHPRMSNMPIVVVSSRNPSEAIQEALDSGATAYLTKPVNWATFSNYVDNIFRLNACAERGRRAEEAARDSLHVLAEISTQLREDVLRQASDIVAVARAALADGGGANNQVGYAMALRAIVDKAQRAETRVSSLVSLLNGEGPENAPSAPGSGHQLDRAFGRS